jgi:hypothetical protein
MPALLDRFNRRCDTVKKGNGKVKVKEPMEMANKAINQLRVALDFVKSTQ